MHRLLSVCSRGLSLGLIYLSAWAASGEPITKTNLIAQAPNLSATTNAVRSFDASGVIRELAEDGSSVTIRHEAIRGFMPKMTMEFTVKSPSELNGLKVGDAVTFRVFADSENSWIQDIHVVAASNPPTAPKQSDPSSATLLKAARLKDGDPMPDLELLAEDDHRVQLADFRGKALAFTFIFTRCPLPDFCPRMSLHFSRAREALLQQPGSPTNWQFLSISFDPENDRPEVLANYAKRYRGNVPDRWLFAVGSTNVLATFAQTVDLRATSDAGSFVHNLRTVVLNTQGRIYRQFDGNRWTADDLAKAMREAATAKP